MTSSRRDKPVFHIPVDSPAILGENPLESALQEQAAASRCAMLGGSSNRRPKDVSHRRILLIDRCQATREVRVNVLQSHGVEVHAVEDFSSARVRWQPCIYDFVLLDVRRYQAAEALEWCEEIKDRSPRQRIVFLVGAPTYLSLTWPGEVIAEAASSGQWGETVKRILAAA